jgi:flagellar assembly protein FliH
MESLIRTPSVGMRLRLSQVQAQSRGESFESHPGDERSRRNELESQLREQMAQQWQAERDGEFESARREGLESARLDIEAASLQEAARVREEMMVKVSQALEAIEKTQRALADEFSANLGELAFAVTCRLIGQVARSPQFIRSLIEKACGELRGDLKATVRLHPDDLAILNDHASLRLAEGNLQLDYQADASLELGGCIIEAQSGRYDGSLETQLRRLHDTLARVKTSAPAP